MKASIIYILLSLTSILAFGQKTLTKEELLQYFKTFHTNKELLKDSIKLTWSDELNTKLRHRIFDLKSSGIDSLIVYSVSHPGSAYILDSCTSIYSTSAYLIRKFQEKVTIEKFKGQCQSTVTSHRSEDIFTFYTENLSKLKDEIFMPIIYSGQIIDSNRITYTTSASSHEPNYSLYYDIDSIYNSFSFGESEISDKKSIFYNYNLNLAFFYWWKLISEQVKE